MDLLVATIAISVLNLLLLIWLAAKTLGGKGHRSADLISSRGKEISIMYFTDVEEVKGMFKNRKRVIFKGHLMCDGIPIGGPFIVMEQTVEEVNQERINAVIQEFAAPLAQAGLKVIAKAL